MNANKIKKNPQRMTEDEDASLRRLDTIRLWQDDLIRLWTGAFSWTEYCTGCGIAFGKILPLGRFL